MNTKDRKFYTAVLVEYKIRMAVHKFEASVSSNKVDCQVEDFLKIMANSGDQISLTSVNTAPKKARYLLRTLRNNLKRIRSTI